MLLAVFVPMLLMSAFHVHQSSGAWQEECSECVDHHCGGHLGQYAGGAIHDCVLCGFLTLTFVPAVIATAVIYYKVVRLGRVELSGRIVLRNQGVVGLRAPPVFR